MQAVLISGLTAGTAIVYLTFPVWFPRQQWAATFVTVVWQACQVRLWRMVFWYWLSVRESSQQGRR